MEKSLLFATHVALKKLMLDCGIWSLFVYIPGNKFIGINFSNKWKIKTTHFYKSTGKTKYSVLKCYDSSKDKFMPIVFDFGYLTLKKYAGIASPSLFLVDGGFTNMALERHVVEHICKLSDDGFAIVSNDRILLDKNKGSELLISIDIDEPSYSYMNDDHSCMNDLPPF